ncbi:MULTISPECIES: hypothetical protein [Myxococcaceae]|uniref:hypothetical protein n=1 Tax=Myxococcaceae TaxID=31 RepID=UPI0018905024|nr:MULTISPECIES: hypothetical protein [Myxococcaceae]MBF5046228.1 hypothetical protein [Simulacricoccus sp. 17bor-14]
MKRTWKVAAVAVVAALGVFGAACEPLDEGGGAGVDGPLTFDSGYVFVRGSANDVYLVNASEPNVAQQLTTTGSARHPALSRDGRSVVYARFAGTASELVIQSTTQGSTPRVLLTASGIQATRLGNPIFNPTATQVVFVYTQGTGASTVSLLGLVNADGTNFRRLAGGATISYGAPTFLRDGSAVIAPVGSSPNELDGLDEVFVSQVSTLPITNNLQSNQTQLIVANRVALSPDGTHLAFDAQPVSGGATRIYVAAFSGTVVDTAARLSNSNEGQESFPTWTNASSVAFSSSAGGGSDNVYTVNVNSIPGSLVFAAPSAREPWFGPL